MRRMTAMAMALLVPALLSGCEEDDDGPLGVENELVGEFAATDFGFTGTVDAGLVQDFDAEGATFALTLNEGGTFETRFVQAGVDPLVRTGTFTVAGDQLVLGNQALFPFTRDVAQRFTFERVGNTLTLRSADPVRFDFDADAAFEENEAALFEGEFLLR